MIIFYYRDTRSPKKVIFPVMSKISNEVKEEESKQSKIVDVSDRLNFLEQQCPSQKKPSKFSKDIKTSIHHAYSLPSEKRYPTSQIKLNNFRSAKVESPKQPQKRSFLSQSKFAKSKGLKKRNSACPGQRIPIVAKNANILRESPEKRLMNKPNKLTSINVKKELLSPRTDFIDTHIKSELDQMDSSRKMCQKNNSKIEFLNPSPEFPFPEQQQQKQQKQKPSQKEKQKERMQTRDSLEMQSSTSQAITKSITQMRTEKEKKKAKAKLLMEIFVVTLYPNRYLNH